MSKDGRGYSKVDWGFCANEKDADAIDRWQLVHNRANTHVVALDTGGYGVNAALVLQAQNEIDAFKNCRGKPRAEVVNKKVLNESLDNEFKKSGKIIDSVKERLVQFAIAMLIFIMR